jgi:hypothetical protein
MRPTVPIYLVSNITLKNSGILTGWKW